MGAAAGLTLASLAMAGPSWRQQAQPMFQASAPLLVVLDLSSRITATDLPPSRLLQARAKVGELLRARQRAGRPGGVRRRCLHRGAADR
jgi:Ca-activated chloride channel family protein